MTKSQAHRLLTRRAVDPMRLVEAEPLATLLALADRATERDLLICATEEIVTLLGERGTCILVDGAPRAIFSTYAPALVHLPIDLARYPEIADAIARRNVVYIEDARN